MSPERPFPDDPDEPGLGFQAGFGFYLGLVVTGFVAIGGLFADASTGSLLGILPSTLTAVTIVGHILTKRARGLPERIGGSRWRQLASYAPSAAFAVLSFVLGPAVGAVSITARLAFMTIAFVLLTGVSAFGVNAMCRKRYVEAIAGDEPTVSWTATTIFPFLGEKAKTGAGVVLFFTGLAAAATGYWFGLFWSLYSLVFLVEPIGKRLDWFDSSDENGWNQESEVSAYDVGLVVDGREFHPWDEIGDVRLTDDELVIERESSRFDLRYDRDSIDDPQAVLEGIERARARAGADAPERDAADSETESEAETLEGTSSDRGVGTEPETEPETEPSDLETETETA